MPWTKFHVRPTPSSKTNNLCPRLLTTRRWLQTKKKFRERIAYVVRDLERIQAGSTFLGASLTTAQAHRTAAKHHPPRVAIFGGAFYPIHNRHPSAAPTSHRPLHVDHLHIIP